ncbi:TDT family transporter [Serratia sp. (in: enterobacteria)]|uniref:TDT family transporter n=1 Tax=Serratia sp. (in: enterobacteria) TaxID=616 RepID=UPI0039894C70
MLRHLHHKVRGLPTPVAGLALGIASLGWCLENALPLHGIGQNTGALIAAVLLCVIAARFILHPDTLAQDLKHPVMGSIIPTFAMAAMVVSKALGHFLPLAGQILWVGAVLIHLTALTFFIYHRAQQPNLHHMVPSWFIPPVGIIVADVSCPADAYTEFALILLAMGMVSYLLMLPIMIYRLMFRSEVPDAAKPTIAIMAAPASLSLAGYLTVVKEPSMLICAVLLGVALLMTIVIYCAFFRLMRLPFSPGYAAFTFPMAIGATALYKMANLLSSYPQAAEYAHQLYMMATAEAVVASLVISYVSVLFIHHYLIPKNRHFHQGVVK